MSGGSYDYLCFKDADELSAYESQLSSMAARLAGLGYAEDAARETEETLLILRQMKVRLQARIDRLSGVWKAVEWWDSCDTGEDGVKDALADYRKDVAGICPTCQGTGLTSEQTICGCPAGEKVEAE